MLTHVAWVNLRKGKIGISLGNERNHLDKEQDSWILIAKVQGQHQELLKDWDSSVELSRLKKQYRCELSHKQSVFNNQQKVY